MYVKSNEKISEIFPTLVERAGLLKDTPIIIFEVRQFVLNDEDAKLAD